MKSTRKLWIAFGLVPGKSGWKCRRACNMAEEAFRPATLLEEKYAELKYGAKALLRRSRYPLTPERPFWKESQQ